MILAADWVLPVSSSAIRRGFVEIESGRVARVGRRDELPGSAVVEELGSAALIPGLVNAHTHLELTCYAGAIPPQPFWPWIAELIALRSREDSLARETQAVIDGAWRSLRAGVTCVGDISRRNIAWRGLKPLPIRKVCFVELLSIADWPPHNLAQLRREVESVQEDALLTVGVSPHAPYSVPAGQVRGAIDLAASLRKRWTMHWAETPEEVAFLCGDASSLPTGLRRLMEEGGVGPTSRDEVEWIERVAAHQPGLLAHANYVSPDALSRLAATACPVVFCPRAHAYFGHAAYPLDAMRRAGVPVALGTDSLASNESLSMLAEMNAVVARFGVDPEEALRMATQTASDALDLGRQVGTLEAGKWADLAAFPCRRDAEPLREIISRQPAPLGVWVAGERVTL